MERTDDAIESLSRALYLKMEHLDPSPEETDWRALSDWERQFYRTCVRYLLSDCSLVIDALNLTGNNYVHRSPEHSE